MTGNLVLFARDPGNANQLVASNELICAQIAGRCDEAQTDVPRALFAESLRAEGFDAFEAYVEPLYMLPAFQRRRVIGRDGFPFTLTNRTYEPGLCPNCESLYSRELLGYPICAFELSDEIVEQLIEAFRKIHDGRDALAKLHEETVGG